MRHRRKVRSFGRSPKQRKSLMRNQVTSLILHDAIQTTDAKAKELRSILDRIITIAKKRTPALAIREINTYVYSPAASRKVIEVLKEKYADRTSGFTRIHKLGTRPSDAAPYVRIELV